MHEQSNSASNTRDGLWRGVGYGLIAFTLAWGLGQAARDAKWATGLLFFIPSPVLAVASAVSATRAARRRNWRWTVTLTLLAIPPLLFVVSVENQFLGRTTSTTMSDTSTALEAETLRVVHWNVWHGKLGWSTIRPLLDEKDADLTLLSEAPDIVSSAEFPEHYVWRRGTLAAVSRFPISKLKDLSHGDRLLYSFTWEPPGRRLTVLLADHPSSLSVHRRPMIESLCADMVAEHADLVLGDLNSPRRSVALDSLPDGFRHAYAVCGRGWSYTWPSPLPVFAIDQCICGPRVEPVSYKLDSTLVSDHRMQVLDFHLTGARSK